MPRYIILREESLDAVSVTIAEFDETNTQLYLFALRIQLSRYRHIDRVVYTISYRVL